MMTSIDTIKIECDERGFELHFTDDEGYEFQFNMHNAAEALWDEMVAKVGPWVLEKAAARRDYERRQEQGIQDGPWPGEDAYEYWKRTGDSSPLLDMADRLRDEAKTGA